MSLGITASWRCRLPTAQANRHFNKWRMGTEETYLCWVKRVIVPMLVDMPWNYPHLDIRKLRGLHFSIRHNLPEWK